MSSASVYLRVRLTEDQRVSAMTPSDLFGTERYLA
jgi:hypothetical protein